MVAVPRFILLFSNIISRSSAHFFSPCLCAADFLCLFLFIVVIYEFHVPYRVAECLEIAHKNRIATIDAIRIASKYTCLQPQPDCNHKSDNFPFFFSFFLFFENLFIKYLILIGLPVLYALRTETYQI